MYIENLLTAEIKNSLEILLTLSLTLWQCHLFESNKFLCRIIVIATAVVLQQRQQQWYLGSCEETVAYLATRFVKSQFTLSDQNYFLLFISICYYSAQEHSIFGDLLPSCLLDLCEGHRVQLKKQMWIVDLMQTYLPVMPLCLIYP